MTIRITDQLPAEARGAQCAIRNAVRQWGRTNASNAALAQVAAQHPDTFFPAAFALLEAPPSACPGLRPALVNCPEFLASLAEPGSLPLGRVREAFRRMAQGNHAPVAAAARQTLGEIDAWGLDTPSWLRLLAVLGELSPGPRLALLLDHLANHPDPRVATKAALALGRRAHGREWAERFLQADDLRVRANAVEALWGRRAPWARALLWRAAAQENNRVVGNAVYGLHLLGETAAAGMAQHMLGDARPQFRFTAAWVMGKMGNPEFQNALLLALGDADSRVRHSATRGLEALLEARQRAIAAGLASPAAQAEL